MKLFFCIKLKNILSFTKFNRIKLKTPFNQQFYNLNRTSFNRTISNFQM